MEAQPARDNGKLCQMGVATVVEGAETAVAPAAINSPYRPEIDGLRALAVMAVIINHFNRDLLPSGYLGVDIFFVISGYVITASLSRRGANGLADFLSGFYARRLKRLLPALVLFVLVISVLICLFNPDPHPAIRTAISSLFGLSNLYLLKQSTDYFAQSTELNPFTHTWSLGVEEQFYLLFPFLVWFSGYGQRTKTGSRNLFLLIGILTVASWLSFVYLYQRNQPAAYFLMPSRFWEMAIGCLLFITAQDHPRILRILGQFPASLVVVAMVGIMFLPVSGAVPATAAIVTLSAVLLACLKKGSFAFSFFTQPTIIFIGLISYSLYLWHWGVLSISRWTIGIHWWTVPWQVAVMILLAFSSYRWVETPARTKPWFSKRDRTFYFALLVLIGSVLSLVALARDLYKRLYVAHYPYEELMLPSREYAMGRPALKPDYRSARCHLGRFDNHLPVNCMIDGRRGQTFFFMGNSHADHYREAQYLLAKNEGVSVDGITVSVCIFPAAANPYDCSDIQWQREEQVIRQMKAGDVAVLSNRYVVQDDPYGWLKTTKTTKAVDDFANKVFAKGGKVIVFAPSPEFPLESRLCLRLWFRPHPHEECETTIQQMRSERKQAYTLIRTLDRRIFIYDPLPALCVNQHCSIVDAENKPLFRDKDHLTDYANRAYIYPSFIRFLRVNQLI